jgi:hypothetical protein
MPYRKAVLRAAALLACALFALPALAYDDIEIKNWAAPPYWVPQQAAVQAEPGGREALASERRALNGAGSTPMPFVAVTPCRVADTRAGSGFTGDYGQPALQAQVSRPFVIAGQCGIPAAAQAVSFLFTAVNMTATGNFRVFPSGGSMPAAGGVLVWAATTPFAVENSAIEPLGGSPGAINVYLNGGLGTSADLVIDVNGYYAPVGIVNSVSTLTGDVVLSPGANVGIAQSGNTLTFSSVGTLTGVTAGTGLVGGGTSGNPTLSFNSGVVQTRVTGSCAAGSAMRGINSDGSVICDTLPGRLLSILESDIGAPNSFTGYQNFVTNHVPAVNERVVVHSRCTYDAPANMIVSFRNAYRTPTGTGGSVNIGNAFYLHSSAGPSLSTFNAVVEGFDLVAGNSYDFGIWGGPTPAASGNPDYCSMVILVFSR